MRRAVALVGPPAEHLVVIAALPAALDWAQRRADRRRCRCRTPARRTGRVAAVAVPPAPAPLLRTALSSSATLSRCFRHHRPAKRRRKVSPHAIGRALAPTALSFAAVCSFQK